MKKLLIFLLIACGLCAQTNPPGAGLYTNVSTGGGSGSPAFSAITSGTNTTAAMVVGTGASLAASGSGTIDATTLLTKTWAVPAAIGSTTPAAGSFTTVSASSQLTSTVSTGSAPFVVASTTQVANLNAATAGTATNATNVATTASTTNASFFPLFVASSSNSNQAASLATGWTFNPSTGVSTFPGDINTTGTVSSGTAASTAGALVVKQGTTQSTGTTNITIQAPPSVTSYIRTLPGAVGSTGYVKETVSGSVQTESVVTTIAAADIAVGALADGMTGTTQAVRSADTKLATDAYANAAGNGQVLGTKASPDTTAGAITWANAPVYLIQTSTAAATRTYTLPAASGYTGKAVRLCVATGTGHANFQPASGAALVLNGTLLTADHYIQLAVTAAGDAISLYSDGTNWNSIGAGTAAAGAWADASSP